MIHLTRLLATTIIIHTLTVGSPCLAQAIISTQRYAPIGVVIFESSFQSFPMEAFVDGYVSKNDGESFIFPVGDADRFRPFCANAENVSGAYYFLNPESSNNSLSIAGGPFSTSSKSADVARVSTIEFWDINGANSTKLSLTWNSDSRLNSLLEEKNLAHLKIVGWDGSKWVIIPSSIDERSIFETTSSLSSGSITTINPIQADTYQVYTLAMEKVSALPVNLVSFEAKKENSRTFLCWVTTSEVSSSHFEVQRSSDGKNWFKLGFVRSKRNFANEEPLATSRAYQFTDSEPALKENLYRLKMTDLDQSFSYSQIRSVFHDIVPEATFYPNPAVKRLFVNENIKRASAHMSIHNSRGEKVLELTPIPAEGISLENFTPGTYIVSVREQNGRVITSKIVINK